jgi:hypothetical protein
MNYEFLTPIVGKITKLLIINLKFDFGDLKGSRCGSIVKLLAIFAGCITLCALTSTM